MAAQLSRAEDTHFQCRDGEILLQLQMYLPNIAFTKSSTNAKSTHSLSLQLCVHNMVLTQANKYSPSAMLGT